MHDSEKASLSFEVPITTTGGDNSRTSRLADNERAKREQKALLLTCASYRLADGCNLKQLLRAMAAKGPLDVRVVRLHTGMRACDPHNLGSRLKGVIDGLAKVFEVDDGDPRIRYLPDQARAEVAGVRVEVAPRAEVLPWPRWTAEEWREVAQCLRIVAHERWSLCPANAKRCAQQAKDAEAMAIALEEP